MYNDYTVVYIYFYITVSPQHTYENAYIQISMNIYVCKKIQKNVNNFNILSCFF